VPDITLRPVRASDLDVLDGLGREEDDPWNFFGFRPSDVWRRRFAENGLISEENGTLVIADEAGTVLGDISWRMVHYGPTAASRAYNLGITLLPRHRGKGYGSAAQAELARYLFRTTAVQRVEASTDIQNLAEQRALEKAGFQREGVLRRAQYRAGDWHDLAVYSVLRGEL
jgi:RimJ/RimL family protein N-acetyltransferase